MPSTYKNSTGKKRLLQFAKGLIICLVFFLWFIWAPSNSLKTEGVSEPPVLRKLLNDNESNPWKKELFGRLDRVREKCGSLCSINDLKSYELIGKHTPGESFSTFTTPVDCPAIFQMEEIDAGDTTVPYPLPEELLDLYSMHGGIEFKNWKQFKNIYLNHQALENVWSIERIENDLKLLADGRMEGTYGAEITNNVLKQLMQQGGLKDHSVLVVGSSRPWAEIIALHAGATRVTTLEYGAIKSEHPQIHAMTPEQFRTMYLKGNLPLFDSVLSFSSLEHSGLGRYGDALNPWGDILSMARCWCVTRPQGLLLLGVPVGRDRIEFNAHRWYGNIRMPLLTTNWIPVDGTKDYDAVNDILGLRFFRKKEL